MIVFQVGVDSSLSNRDGTNEPFVMLSCILLTRGRRVL